MSKSTTVTVSLDEDAYGVFQSASEIVSKAGIRVPTGQLVQTMINAELSRLSAREIAQRFLKSIMKQVGILSGQIPEDDEDDTIPTRFRSKSGLILSSAEEEPSTSAATEPIARNAAR